MAEITLQDIQAEKSRRASVAGQISLEDIQAERARRQTLKQEEESPILSTIKRGAQAALESAPGRAVVAAGRFVDRFTGAPTRAAIGEAQEAGERLVTGEGGLAEFVARPVAAFGKQFGEAPEKAPTGKELAEKTGLRGVPATVAGIGLDIVADPTNVIPIAAVAKIGLKGTKKAAQLATKAAIQGSAAAADFATGTRVATTGVKAASGAATDSVEYIKKLFNPKVAPDAEEMFDIARKNGIDVDILPEAVEFGKGSAISRGSRKITEGITGQKKLDLHHQSTQQINRALESKIDDIAGGAAPLPADAGNLIKSGMDNAADRVFKVADVTYGSALKEAPLMRISDEAAGELDKVLNTIAKESARTAKRLGRAAPDQATKAKRVVGAIQDIRASKGSYASMLEQMRAIGEIAFKKGGAVGRIPLDTKNLQKLYFAMSESLIKTTAKNFPEMGAKIKRSNKILSEFFTDKSLLSKAAKADVAPEKIFQSLVKNGDTLQIQALKNVLTPEEFGKLKGSFLESLVGRHGADEFISFKQFNNALNRRPDVVKILFSPQELVDIKEIVRLGDRIDIPILSTSGTGASNAFDFTSEIVTKAVANRTVIETLKSRARAAGVAEKAIDEAMDQGTVGISRLIKKLGGLRRGQKEGLLKAAQVVSIQKERE